MTSLHKLIEGKGSEWVRLHLRTRREPRDPDREALIEHLINGLSPVLSARAVHESDQVCTHGREGLVWLAYDVENQLFASLGEGIEDLFIKLKNDQEVEISPGRIRRLEAAAESAGYETERVTMLRMK